MPSHKSYGRTRGVRWNKQEKYFEMLCPTCKEKNTGAYFWPLTIGENGLPEFWIPGNMQSCRACVFEDKRRRERARANSDPEYRERRRQKASDYYRENKEVHSMKHTAYMKKYRLRQKESAA